MMEQVQAKKAPDTQLYGMNHLLSSLDVSNVEFADTFLYKIFGDKLDFRIKHLILYLYIGKADVVFGSSLMYTVILKKLFRSKRKFILLNISLNRLLNESKKKNKLLYKLSINLLNSIDKIVSLSHVQQEQLENIHGIDKAKLTYVPLGVDVDFYKLNFENRADYILSVGRDNGRDYKTIVEVARRMPNQEFQLVLSKRNLKGIEDIPNNVKIFFDLSAEELKTKYNEAKIMLLITHKDEYGDGSDCSGQTVLLDSFASGIPVIATNKAYLKDYATSGVDFMMVEPYDVTGIIAKIRDIETVGRQLAMNARNRVEKEFSTDQMGKKLSDLFLNI